MSSSFNNANDLDRLSRESKLTENAPRILPTEEESIEPEEENPGITMIKAIATLLSEKGVTG